MRLQFCWWRLALVFVVAMVISSRGQDASNPGDASNQMSGESSNSFEDFGPYTGPVVKGVDTTTLSNKVMCGYQGWFGTPGDGSPASGWRHWTRHQGPMADGNAKVDLWPDVSELRPDERFATDFKLAGGRPAEVFSSYEKPTVLRHFQWMREYGIDGVFVQRFATQLSRPRSLNFCNTVLANCREGANLNGRAYAVMYDLSGLPNGQIDDVMRDWQWLRKKTRITDDPAYLHEHGKPVVAVWGVGFNDGRDYTLEECRRLIEFLKNDPQAGGCTVIVGVPAHWRTLELDAVDDPALLDVLKIADFISPWTVGRYKSISEADKYAEKTLKPDLSWCRREGLGYMPVVFPGFSWHNLKGGESGQIPRLHGQFLWSQFLNVKQAGASMVYVAMFDEVDEGTAIFKCANDVPEGEKSKFVTYEGLPSDFYLKMVGQGAKLIRGETLEAESDSKENRDLAVTSVQVNDRSLPIRKDQGVKAGANADTVVFTFGPTANSDWMPNRLRYKLDSYDTAWHEGNAGMNLTVRFFNRAGDAISQKAFNVTGQSAGWNGSLTNSTLTHRRETVTVPSRASRLMVVISSAGPDDTEGVYVVANLTVSEIESNKFPARILIASPLDQPRADDNSDEVPIGWVRDGTHPSMAKIVNIGREPAAQAFAVLDDDPISHAEWRTSRSPAPQVTPGEKLVLEWNEMYSMGLSDIRTASYRDIPAGSYNFEVQEVNIFGTPTGVETSLRFDVPPPFWKTAWFWSSVSAAFVAAVLGTARYLARRRVRLELLELKSQQALERERLRIAQDIHDDLGARVTQISLLTAMAQVNPDFSEKARSEFAHVSQMSRDLVAALYETVWAVNPENDNLDAMGNYICQMVTTLCDRARLRCRFYVTDLPSKPQISSQTRHNLTMAVKEAVHNIIKHAGASEVAVRIDLVQESLYVSVHDDGCGFQVSSQATVGHGLTNMKRRLEEIGGTCGVESEPGQGTTIHLRLTVNKPVTFPNA